MNNIKNHQVRNGKEQSKPHETTINPGVIPTTTTRVWCIGEKMTCHSRENKKRKKDDDLKQIVRVK